MKLHRILLVGLLASGLAACATTTAKPASAPVNPVGRTVSQPLKDLSLMRERPADVLARAAAAPYATDGLTDCAAIAAEIAALDEALGPDVDGKDDGGPSLGRQLVSDALGGALSLPYRGVVRVISGAARRDRQQARAVLAGMVRRGFLKGAARAAECAATARK